MGDVINLIKPDKNQLVGDNFSEFDLVFGEEKLLFDIGYENEKIVFFWYSEKDVESGNSTTVYEKEVSLSLFDRFFDLLLNRDSSETLKTKTLKTIKKSINEFEQSVTLNENMNDIITEISNAGKNSSSQTSHGH